MCRRVQLVFAFTNGYTASCEEAPPGDVICAIPCTRPPSFPLAVGMMQGPGQVPAEGKELSGFLMALFLQGGIFTGSALSLSFAGV